MKTFYVIIFSLLTCSVATYSQNKLTLEITNLRSNNGQILLKLLDENEKELKDLKGVIKNGKCTIIIENLKPAKYAFKFFHDENNNNKMDKKFMGIPEEGFGFSNNAKGNFGPPAFEKTIFEVKAPVTMTCNVTYL